LSQQLADMVAQRQELVDVEWLHGFLSGIAVGSQLDILREPDASSLDLWVDNYCQQHPLDSIRDAGYELSSELTKRMRGR
jgi:hypothetical protein